MSPQEKAAHTRRRNSVIEKMKALHVYKSEFDEAIERYVQSCEDYETARKKWEDSGCPIVTQVVKGDGEVTERKSILFETVKDLRREIRSAELELGMNPKGLKAIQAKGLDAKRTSKLDQILSG